ncbi:TPA: translation elongation factor EF-1 subunit alpha, partial [Candidatus Bathyarchaeota archaeon]|nr:translation elongation factor EF-1 subunit alpha [Candidatus Bathyarchaeota archaeon]
GHVFYLTGVISDRVIREYEERAKELGKETFKYAWVLDRLKEERERGLTIDLALWKFETNKFFFTVIDAPGHRDFVKNMITGTSQADAALLFVSAKHGEYEAGISDKGQTREHSFLAKTLGIDQMVVAINKMDTVNWDQKRFDEVKEGTLRLLRLVGYDIKRIPVIPVSGWTGDNLVKPSENMPWYRGPTLIEALDAFTVPPKPIDKPLRIPVQDVYSISGVGTVPVGRVETGVLKVGDTVLFLPRKAQGEVKSIETHHTRIERAVPGDNIGFNVRGVSRRDIRRGAVCVKVGERLPPIVKEFIGHIIVIYHPTAIAEGYTPVLHVHTAHVPCRFAELISKIDPRTGQTIEERPKFLRTGDSALIRFEPLKPVVLEGYSDLPQLGRFAIRDMGSTVAAGIVKEITKTV